MRNIVWGIVEKIITILMPFICRTVFIKVLGAEYLGLNSLFSSILQVLSISELGIGTAIVFSMYKPIAEDDEETLCALLNVYKKIYQVIGTVILAVGLSIIPILPKLISGSYPLEINIYALYLIYLLILLLGIIYLHINRHFFLPIREMTYLANELPLLILLVIYYK